VWRRLQGGTRAAGADADLPQSVGVDEPSTASLAAGGDVTVTGAGELVVKDGRLVHIDSMSGHYRPSAGRERDVRDELARQGLPTEYSHWNW
jgi:hypothetical protein